MKLILLALIIINISLLAKDVATITAIRGEADIKRANKLIVATLGSKLEAKDHILTKENSKLQIIFKDETVISIGKNSDFSISEYLFEDNTPPVAKFSMLRGAMRTITGKIGDIAPQKFSVSTKTSTIGIRGTNFSLFVEDDGSSSVFCTYGAISVSINGIVHIIQQGFYITISASGEVEIKEFTPKILKEKKEQHFDGKKDAKDAVETGRDGTGADGYQKEGIGNTTQLDVTTDDNSGLIITDVSDIVEDATQKGVTSSNLELTPNSQIADYVQNSYNARYTGTFSGTSTDPIYFDTAGSVIFTVDFGAQRATMDFEGDNGVGATYTNFSNLNTNTFSGGSGLNTVKGSFYGPTANTAKGSYEYDNFEGTQASGTYNTTFSSGSSQQSK